jgi:hypothetical protein
MLEFGVRAADYVTRDNPQISQITPIKLGHFIAEGSQPIARQLQLIWPLTMSSKSAG